MRRFQVLVSGVGAIKLGNFPFPLQYTSLEGRHCAKKQNIVQEQRSLTYRISKQHTTSAYLGSQVPISCSFTIEGWTGRYMFM